jgi:hypothetical protein
MYTIADLLKSNVIFQEEVADKNLMGFSIPRHFFFSPVTNRYTGEIN